MRNAVSERGLGLRVCNETGCIYDRRVDCDGCGASLCVYHSKRAPGLPFHMKTDDEGKDLSYCSDCVKANGCEQPGCEGMMAFTACDGCGKPLCLFDIEYHHLGTYCSECEKTAGVLPPQMV